MVAHEIVVVGGGGHAKVVAELARAGGWTVLGFADDPSKHRELMGRPVATLETFPTRAAVVVGIGSPRIRSRVFGELKAAGRELPALVHPSAYVEPTAALGEGTVVCAKAVVGVDAVIGSGAIVNTGATVDHDDRLGDFAHVAPGSHLAGTVTVGEGTWIGIGATVIQGLTIGAWTTVGAGSVVVRPLPDEVIAVGVPAVIRRQGRYF